MVIPCKGPFDQPPYGLPTAACRIFSPFVDLVWLAGSDVRRNENADRKLCWLLRQSLQHALLNACCFHCLTVTALNVIIPVAQWIPPLFSTVVFGQGSPLNSIIQKGCPIFVHGYSYDSRVQLKRFEALSLCKAEARPEFACVERRRNSPSRDVARPHSTLRHLESKEVSSIAS